jgi:hypothetical protein
MNRPKGNLRPLGRGGGQNVVVGGSQVFYVNLGLALPSKDVDLFIEEFNPLELSRLIAEALGLLEGRFELFRRG